MATRRPYRLPALVTTQKGVPPLNPEGLQLYNLAAWHVLRIGNTGMLAAGPEGSASQPLGSIPNPAATQRRVWLDEPPGSVSFNEKGFLQLPPAALDTDVILLSFNIPRGYDGVIKWITNTIMNTVPAFVPGDLIWKINADGRPIRNYGNIMQQNGTVAQGCEVSPLRVFSGQLITLAVQEVSTGPSGGTLSGQTVGGLAGYYYPSRGVS